VHGRDVVRAVVDDDIDAPARKVDRFLQRAALRAQRSHCGARRATCTAGRGRASAGGTSTQTIGHTLCAAAAARHQRTCANEQEAQ
jgi:hypothetical protein